MSLRILATRGFMRAAAKFGLTDRTMIVAAREIEAGLVDPRLGGFLVKKRIGVDGRGKSGGLRTILAYRQSERLVFLYVFGKNERDNISERERMALLELRDEYMRLTADCLDGLVAGGRLNEVAYHEQTKDQQRHSGGGA